ncbi:zinc finger and BTB domain-containing protein 25 [Spea bombifrons]|uniref:zinc finger and BTB domain-containing protein 25 n=1 Tax=Spea bombifrons TaxID=233779 RepID=UPI0023499CC3|nr:zinc finger and BTB domain-containing protein 25 [Spea bombifrons]
MDASSHSLALLQQLNLQREFGFLCDCTVAIGDVYFKAHRAVLAAFSSYFKMIFIHQSSECIKIQPTDIQPDVFSYLLHVMYTGKTPKQMVDQFRLEEGVRFLHANLFPASPKEPRRAKPSETLHSSNLYGIQISTTQKLPKESIDIRDHPSNAARSTMQGEHPHLQLSLAIGLEGVGPEQQSSPFPGPAAVKSMEEIQKTTASIKQEAPEPEAVSSPERSVSSPEGSEAGFLKDGSRAHSCHYCGENFQSRLSLRDHLHIHVSQSLPFGVPSSILEGDDLGEVRPVPDTMEDAESYRLGSLLLNRNDEPLQSSNLSFLSKDADPLELNCNFSFLRKRKFSCVSCGHKFTRRNQLLEHPCAHKTKPLKVNRSPRFGHRAEQTLESYGNDLTDYNERSSDASQDHPEFPGETEPTPQQGSVESVLVE